MLIEFNMNDYVKVKLTEIGKKELERQHHKVYEECVYKQPYEPMLPDKDGWYKFQFHDLMHKFGRLMFMGSNLPFETTVKIEANN